MENKNQQNQQEQDFDKSTDAALGKTNAQNDGNNISDEDIEPVLDEEDLKENHLKEEDLDNIVWDTPAKPNEDLSTATSEKDITD